LAPDQRLASPVSTCLRMLIEDFQIRAGTDKTAPIFQRIDDKWLFTRSYFETLASSLGVFVNIEPLNLSDAPFSLQTQTNLRLALGLSPEDALVALPNWAWDILRGFDAAFSPELKRELPIEAGVIFTRVPRSSKFVKLIREFAWPRTRPGP
jgi:hypothetical protein